MKPLLYILLPLCLFSQVPQTESTLTPSNLATQSQTDALKTQITSLHDIAVAQAAQLTILKTQTNANSQTIVNLYAAVRAAGIDVPELAAK